MTPESLRRIAAQDWVEPPDIALGEWRVRLPVARASGEFEPGEGSRSRRDVALQVEFMSWKDDDGRVGGSAIVSPVIGGVRGIEFVLGPEALRALRDLLNATDLSEGDNVAAAIARTRCDACDPAFECWADVVTCRKKHAQPERKTP